MPEVVVALTHSGWPTMGSSSAVDYVAPQRVFRAGSGWPSRRHCGCGRVCRWHCARPRSWARSSVANTCGRAGDLDRVCRGGLRRLRRARVARCHGRRGLSMTGTPQRGGCCSASTRCADARRCQHRTAGSGGRKTRPIRRAATTTRNPARMRGAASGRSPARDPRWSGSPGNTIIGLSATTVVTAAPYCHGCPCQGLRFCRCLVCGGGVRERFGPGQRCRGR